MHGTFSAEESLRIRLCRYHCMDDIEDHDVVLAAGESVEFSRDRGRSANRPAYDFFCFVYDIGSGYESFMAVADKIAHFLDYPVAMELHSADRTEPGQSVPVTVSYRNLSDSAINGSLILQAEGRPLLTQELPRIRNVWHVFPDLLPRMRDVDNENPDSIVWVLSMSTKCMARFQSHVFSRKIPICKKRMVLYNQS